MSLCCSLYFFNMFSLCFFDLHFTFYTPQFLNLANQYATVTPRIATLTRNRHTCLTMVSNLECTTLIPIVLAATNLKFSTQTFIMLLKIWISLVSQRPIRLRNLRSRNQAIITLRSCEKRRLLPDLTRGHRSAHPQPSCNPCYHV